MRRAAPGVGGVVGPVGRAGGVVDEAVVGALVADDLDAGGLERVDVGRAASTGRRCPTIASVGARARRGHGVERLALASALPVLGHPDHPVERRPPGAKRPVPAALSVNIPPMQNPMTPTGSTPGGVGRGHARRRARARRRACRPRQPLLAAAGPRARATARPRTPPSRCSSASRGALVVEQRPQAQMSGTARTRPRDGRAVGAGELGRRAGRQRDAHAGFYAVGRDRRAPAGSGVAVEDARLGQAATGPP